MTRLSKALLVTGALTVAGLAQAGTVTYVDQHPFYTPELVGYSASVADGRMPIAVVGNPFDGGDAALAGNLALPGFGISSMVPIEADGPRKGGHIVLVFNPAGNAPGGEAICEDAAGQALSAPRGEYVIQAAFCYSSDVVAEAVLSTPATPSPDDPGFRQSMHALISSMMPLHLKKDGGCANVLNC